MYLYTHDITHTFPKPFLGLWSTQYDLPLPVITHVPAKSKQHFSIQHITREHNLYYTNTATYMYVCIL